MRLSPGKRHSPGKVEGMKCVEPNCENGILELRWSPKHDRFFYGCSNYPRCIGSLPANRDGSPQGEPRTKQLMGYRQVAHEVFDVLWKDRHVSRSQAYIWFQAVTGKEPKDAHIFNLDIKGCKELIDLVRTHGPGTSFWDEWCETMFAIKQRKQIAKRIMRTKKLIKKRAKNKVKHSKKKRSKNKAWYISENQID